MIRTVSNKSWPKYVAMSYVSSHGLANPNANSLPMCQIIRLGRMASNFDEQGGPDCFWQGTSRHGVWIDTLLVPLRDKYPKLYTEAIRRMQAVYTNAACVFMLDAHMQQQPLPTTPEQFLALFAMSPWLTRLWTFSEGSLAAGTLVLFGNRGVESLDAFLTDNPKFLLDTEDLTGYPSPMWTEVLLTVERLRTLHRLRQRFFKYQKDIIMPHFLDCLISSVRHRQTSRQEDEVLCLALSLDLEYSRTSDASAQKMAWLYSQLPHLPAALSLMSGPRLTQPGYRWAPASLLGRREVFRNSHTHDHTIRDPDLGMKVPATYHVFLLKPVKELSAKTGVMDRNFRWGVSPVTTIFFYIGEDLFYIRTPEDSASQWSPAKELYIPTSTEDLYTMAVMIRARTASGSTPAAFLEVLNHAAGKPVLARKAVSTDDAAPELISTDNDHIVMPDGTNFGEAKDKYFEREARLGITEHYLTKYSGWSEVYQLTGQKMDHVKYDWEIDDGFKDIAPWDEDRLCCEAIVLELATTEVWVS